MYGRRLETFREQFDALHRQGVRSARRSWETAERLLGPGPGSDLLGGARRSTRGADLPDRGRSEELFTTSALASSGPLVIMSSAVTKASVRRRRRPAAPLVARVPRAVHPPHPAPKPRTRAKTKPIARRPRRRQASPASSRSRTRRAAWASRTTAVSLGAALADLGYRVLVVDLDPQGNASTGMGIRHEAREITVYDVIVSRGAGRTTRSCRPRSSVCHAIPSTIDLAGAEIELVSQFSRETRLKKALGRRSGRACTTSSSSTARRRWAC